MKFHEPRREPPKQPHWEKEREWEIPIGHQSRYRFIYTVIMIIQHVVITQHNNWNCIYFLCKITFAQTRWKFKFYLFFKKKIFAKRNLIKKNQTVNAIVFFIFSALLQKGTQIFRQTKLLSGHELEIPNGIEIKKHQPFNFVH